MLRKINLLLVILTFLALANTTFASVTLNLSTGVNVGLFGNPLYSTAAGTRDDYWFVRPTQSFPSVPLGTKSWIITMGAWNSIPGTRPIFANNNSVGTSEYERCFCISDVKDARLDLVLRADNKANLFLNSYFGSPVVQTLVNNTFNTSIPAVTFQYTAANGLKVGKNCIRVRVNNEGGPTGFALKATLQAKAAQDTFQENGCCQQGAPVFTEAFRVRPNSDDLSPLQEEKLQLRKEN